MKLKVNLGIPQNLYYICVPIEHTNNEESMTHNDTVLLLEQIIEIFTG